MQFGDLDPLWLDRLDVGIDRHDDMRVRGEPMKVLSTKPMEGVAVLPKALEQPE